MPAPLVLIVTGAPASGKTTVARRLARDLRLPYLGKDFLKEPLFDALGWSDRAWSRKLGGASMTLLFRCSGALLEAGVGHVLESNFYPQWDTQPLLELQREFGCQFAQVLCTAPGPVLWERFLARERSGERHAGHAGAASAEEFRPILLGDPWPALPLDGPVFAVDTTDFDTIDYFAIVARLRGGCFAA